MNEAVLVHDVSLRHPVGVYPTEHLSPSLLSFCCRPNPEPYTCQARGLPPNYTPNPLSFETPPPNVVWPGFKCVALWPQSPANWGDKGIAPHPGSKFKLHVLEAQCLSSPTPKSCPPIPDDDSSMFARGQTAGAILQARLSFLSYTAWQESGVLLSSLVSALPLLPRANNSCLQPEQNHTGLTLR